MFLGSVRLGKRLDARDAAFEQLYDRCNERLHVEDPFEATRNLRDVLQYKNEVALRDAFVAAANATESGNQLGVFPALAAAVGEEASAASAEAAAEAAPRLEHRVSSGAAAVAVRRVPEMPLNSGYIGARPGERLEILYVGAADNSTERDWIYGRRLPSGARGWLPRSALVCPLLELQLEDEAPSPAAGAADARRGEHTSASSTGGVDAAAPSLWVARACGSAAAKGRGYLDVVSGDQLLVEYVGSEASSDDGWLYGRRLTAASSSAARSDEDKGWFPLSVLQTRSGKAAGRGGGFDAAADWRRHDGHRERSGWWPQT
eukprot:TRINITY_DN11013_c0_g1_i2.p1 TRINITY_DN11013_c0_g1~~TRINITY_DN11013_c0_g1_i2.p1  ORF type:complete len:318 (+),score=79.57 TRINITY_DN11013_c0_g1_i2:218-1171(+)